MQHRSLAKFLVLFFNALLFDFIHNNKIITSSSAIAEGPRDALNQLKSLSAAAQLYEKSHLTRRIALSCGIKNIAGRFFGLVTKHACDGQTDGRTELRLPRPR